LLVAIKGYGSFEVSVLVEKNKKETNPGLEKYCVPLPYTQSTCGAALKDDFSYNKRCV